MRVVILGCGRVGSELSKMLIADGHRVSVIDRSPESFKRLGDWFKGDTVLGAGIDTDVLERAGVREAEAFVSATNGDNTNIMAALMAKEEYHVKEVVIRIYDPLRTAIYREMGLKTICPTLAGASQIYKMIQPGETLSSMPVDDGSHVVLEIAAPATYVGKKLRSLPLPEEAVLSGLLRGGSASVPLPDTRLEDMDRLVILVRTDAVARVKEVMQE